jgi:putative transposase
MEKWWHTSYDCIYHIVLVPKYRKQYLYTVHCKHVWKLLRVLSTRLWCEIVEWNLQRDHIHMVMKIPPKFSVSKVIWELKWKTAILLHNEFWNKKSTLIQKSFWSRWYFVRTTWLDKSIVIEYVRNQSKKDKKEEWNQLDFSW